MGPRGSDSMPTMGTVKLSNRQAKEADRVGGIELLILWPPDLGPEPTGLALGHEREATPAEKAYAERLVTDDCRARGLVPVHVRVARERRPTPHGIEARGEDRVHLAVTIIGRRWVHATGRPQPRVMFA